MVRDAMASTPLAPVTEGAEGRTRRSGVHFSRPGDGGPREPGAGRDGRPGLRVVKEPGDLGVSPRAWCAAATSGRRWPRSRPSSAPGVSGVARSRSRAPAGATGQARARAPGGGAVHARGWLQDAPTLRVSPFDVSTRPELTFLAGRGCRSGPGRVIKA